MKLLPLYMDFHTMSNDLEAMAEAPGMSNKVDEAIRENLKHRFSIDNIDNFDFKNNITVQRTPEHVFVTMEYQVKEPLIANIDLLVSFDKRVELKQ